jgi:hypothetical protein
MRSTKIPVLFSFGLTLLLGCGGGGPSLAPVSGTVTHNGKPLVKGRICFQPATGRPAYGDIVDGKIVDVRTGDNEGVILGPSQIGVSSRTEAADMYTPSESLTPEHYADPKKSGFHIDIRQGETNRVELELRD